MKKKQVQDLLFQLGKNLIDQEIDSKIRSEEIRKEINEHHEYIKERRKKFDLIRNK